MDIQYNTLIDVLLEQNQQDALIAFAKVNFLELSPASEYPRKGESSAQFSYAIKTLSLIALIYANNQYRSTLMIEVGPHLSAEARRNFPLNLPNNIKLDQTRDEIRKRLNGIPKDHFDANPQNDIYLYRDKFRLTLMWDEDDNLLLIVVQREPLTEKRQLH